MNPDLKRAVEQSIAERTGQPASIVKTDSTRGGCINITDLVELSDGRSYFVKSNTNAPNDMFECEAEGLRALANINAIKIPIVIGFGITGSTRFLVLEAIKSGKRTTNFSQEFGHRLAQLHQNSTHQEFGFSKTNYLGSSVQPNNWCHCWIDFWRQNRLGYQFKLARSNGYSDVVFDELADRLLDQLDDFLSIEESPCLIHGDLWSGNFMVGEAGEPVLIDPAVYYGQREAEFGMTTLFGGFDDAFYAAYNEAWPLATGSEERIELYRLYHLLNHLNLFGSSYRGGCLEIMKKFS